MPPINLPYGGNLFDSDSLKEYIRTTGRNYIIQGQKACRRIDHPKPTSLDAGCETIMLKIQTQNRQSIK